MSDKQPPYPADTQAKGWRFELDYERIEQSDTWDLSNEIPMAQHALLMMWYVSWQQKPCGSFPNDESIIRAKCKLKPKMWADLRALLMRGWWLAADGRLYHDAIVTCVLDMLDKRMSNAERTRLSRERKKQSQADNASVTRDTQVTNALLTSEFDTKNQEPRTLINTPPPQPAGAKPSIEVFPISESWQPSEQFVTLAKLAGLAANAATGPGLGEFKAYWLTQPHTVRTQLEWDNALVKSLKHEAVKAASSPRQPPRKTGHTGFETKDYTAGVNPDGSLA